MLADTNLPWIFLVTLAGAVVLSWIVSIIKKPHRTRTAWGSLRGGEGSVAVTSPECPHCNGRCDHRTKHVPICPKCNSVGSCEHDRNAVVGVNCVNEYFSFRCPSCRYETGEMVYAGDDWHDWYNKCPYCGTLNSSRYSPENTCQTPS
jgi:hypothetical protein